MKKDIVERFINYVKFETTSDPKSKTCPTTPGQMVLAKYLVEELLELGLKDAQVDKNAYVMATLPANDGTKKTPTLGFLAHLDTSFDSSGKDVKPQIIKNYDGKDIVLNKSLDIRLSPKEFPELRNYIGEDLITTDGTTLLGADDKAGVVEIIAAVDFLVHNPQIKHGTIKIGFLPDEEIGRGPHLFDVKKFGANFAYTIDGGAIGELNYETFNALEAKIKITGLSVHPGRAKNKMINALLLAYELHSMLPVHERPESTEAREGFYLLHNIHGGIESAEIGYILRDHDASLNERRKMILSEAAKFLEKKYGENISIKIEFTEQYRNMIEKILPHKDLLIGVVEDVMKNLDITPNVYPMRGGTDGAQLSFKGLPCPNIFTGGHNFHGVREYIPISSMKKAVEVIVGVITEFHKRSK